MPIMTGTVSCIRVFDDAGFTQLVDSAGDEEIFILWFAPPEISAFERIMHSTWVSLLREAMVNGLPVSVVHPDGNARITSLQLGTLQ